MSESPKPKQKLGSHPMWGLLSWLYSAKAIIIILSFVFSVKTLYTWIHQGAGLNIGFFGHHQFVSWVLAACFTAIIIWGYLEASTAVLFRYKGGYLNGWASRLSAILIFLVLFGALYNFSSTNIMQYRMADVQKPQIHNLFNATAVKQYDIRIEGFQKSIAQIQSLVSSNTKQIKKYDKIKLKRKYNSLWGVEKVKYKNLKTENQKYQKQISFYMQKIAVVEENKAAQQVLLKDHNKKEKKRFEEKENQEVFISNVGSGIIEGALFLITLFISVFRGKVTEIDTTQQTDKRTIDRPTSIESVFTEALAEGSTIDKNALAQEVNNLLNIEVRKKNKLSILDRFIKNRFGYAPVKNAESKIEQPKKEQIPLNTEDKEEVAPKKKDESIKKSLNGASKIIIKKWTPDNAYDLPKLIELEKYEFEFRYLRKPTDEELERIEKLKKKGGDSLIFELQMQRFISNTPQGESKPTIYHNKEFISLTSGSIRTRYKLDNGYQKGHLKCLIGDGSDVMKLFHHSNLVLVQKESVQIPVVMY